MRCNDWLLTTASEAFRDCENLTVHFNKSKCWCIWKDLDWLRLRRRQQSPYCWCLFTCQQSTNYTARPNNTQMPRKNGRCWWLKNVHFIGCQRDALKTWSARNFLGVWPPIFRDNAARFTFNVQIIGSFGCIFRWFYRESASSLSWLTLTGLFVAREMPKRRLRRPSHSYYHPMFCQLICCIILF